MFQRNTRQPFPFRNIAILLAIVIAFVYFLIRQAEKSRLSKENRTINTEQKDHNNSGLKPAEWFYAARNYPEFVPSIAMYTSALREAAGPPVALRPRGGYPGFSAPWTVEGPGNIGARINSIAVHPANPNIQYAGFSGGGLWKTTNGGASWFPIFDEQLFLSIGDIALDPNNPNIVYVGTGDPNTGSYPFIGNGIWKSTDGGGSWKQLGLAADRIISKILVHPSKPNVLFVATMGLPFERNENRGLYKSTDGGNTWNKILYIGPETGITSLIMAPNNPDILYAAAWDRIRNNKESIVFGLNARIWKTTDGGQSWTALSGGLPVGNPMSRIGLAVNPGNSNHVLATYTSADLKFAGLYESFNAGQTWQINPGTGLNPEFRGDFAWYFGRMEINPFNPDDIWMLGITTYRSVDKGKTWYKAVGNGFNPHVDHHDIHFINASTFLLATDGGLYRTDDGGATWAKADDIPTTQFYRVAYNPNSPQNYTGGAQDNGTLVGNADNLNNWSRVFSGDGFQAVYHPDNPAIFYFEYQNGGLYGATDGLFLEDATTGIESSDRRNWDMPICMSRHDPDIMYTGTFRIYQSYGHPAVWAPISPDLTDGIIFGERFHNISAIGESPLDPENVYAGTSDGNVWRGDMSHNNWQNITGSLPGRYVSAIVGSPSDPSQVFVSHTGYRDNDFSPLLYRSDNKGQSWTPINGNLPQLAINDIYVFPDHRDSIIFVGTDAGVWGTLDGGKNWERLGTQMPFIPVYDLDYNSSQKRLFAGTHARSIMSFPIDSLNLGKLSTDAPDRTSDLRITVNPSISNESAVLAVERLSLKKTADVLIINAAGREMARYELRGGTRSEQVLTVGNWPPGVYFAIAQTDGKVWGYRKFIVAR